MISITTNVPKPQSNSICEVIPVCSLSDLQVLIDGNRYISKDIVIVMEPGCNMEIYKKAEQFSLFMNFYLMSAQDLSEELYSYNNQLVIPDEPHIHFNLSEFARMNSGGKCIRGILAKLGHFLFSNDYTTFDNKLGLAFEIFQTAILIHDDIIDHATLRRNKPTIPVRYVSWWGDKTGNIHNDEVADVANSMAICSGDLGIFLSHQVLSRAYHDEKSFSRLIEYFNNVAINTIKGELIDVALPFEEKYRINSSNSLYDSIINIYRLKTSWYTVVGPMCSGAILAGCNDICLNVLEEFCENIGIAFQIKDDIIGIYSEEATLGKNVGSDVSEFKQTLFYYYMASNKKYYEYMLNYYGRQLTIEEFKEFRMFLKTCGALAYVESEMNRYFDSAKSILDKIDFISFDKKNLLYGLLTYLRYRSK